VWSRLLKYINIINFDVLFTVHLSIFISVINQLDVQNFCFTISLFHAPTCFEHCCAHHQEVKFYYTASGIITLCRWPSGAQVERGQKIGLLYAHCGTELFYKRLITLEVQSAVTERRGNIRHLVGVTVRCNEKHYGKSVSITCQLPTVTRLVWMPRAVWRSNPDTVCMLSYSDVM